MKPAQITIDEKLLRRRDRDPEVRADGRRAVIGSTSFAAPWWHPSRTLWVAPEVGLVRSVLSTGEGRLTRELLAFGTEPG